MDGLKIASEHTVRAILIALCDDDEVQTKALNYLAQLEPQAITKARTLPDKALLAANGVKRKATSGLSICVQCESSFDEDDNKIKECSYHNGELEPDYESDFWADHDEDCHGTIDSDWCRKEYPDGFIWTCCEKTGTEEGCKLGRHESDPLKNKRKRDDDDQSEDDEDSEEESEEEEDEDEE